MCASGFGNEAFGFVALCNDQRNAVFDAHRTRSSGVSQAASVAKLVDGRDKAAAMASTSLRHCKVFNVPRTPFGLLPDRRPSDDPFLWFRPRKGSTWWRHRVSDVTTAPSKKGRRSLVYAVQEDLGRSEIQETSTAESIDHTVKEGDTLTSIARKFKTSVQQIALSNQIDDVNYLPVGKLLLVSTQSRNLNEVTPKVYDMEDLSTPSGCLEKAEPSIATQKGSTPLMMPMLSSSLYSQIHLVKLASTLVVLFAVFSFVKRYLGDWAEAKIHKEVLRRQAEKEIHDVHRRPKLRRWQGILDEDREMDEPDMILSADGQIPVKSEMSSRETEEEKLRQSYAQLECVYAKFLADSGLSKSGYWRGGVPPASEED